jgi:hypothetical protein
VAHAGERGWEMTTELKFQAGMNVIISTGFNARLSRRTVDRVLKNGNFVLKGSPKQYRQSGAQAGEYSYMSPVVLAPTPANEARYVEQQQKLAVECRVGRVRAAINGKLDIETLCALEAVLGLTGGVT